MKLKKLTILLTAFSLFFSGTSTAFAQNGNSTNSPAPTNEVTATDGNDTSSKVAWPKGPSVVASAAIVMEASTGAILYEKNIYDKHYPASITKILTGIIAIENVPLDDIVTFSYNAVHQIDYGSTHIGMREGEQITMNDCLHGLLLASANEVANAIAEHVATTRDEFANMMNAYCEKLGCKNSHFVNPSGLHDDDHYTCCYDMALISQSALKNETFREINKTKSYIIPETNLVDQTRPIANHHQMLTGAKAGFTQYKYESCIGGKTGYTQKARNTLVTFAEKDGMTLICVVMDTTTHDQYKDTIALFDFAFNNYKTYKISENEDSQSIVNSNQELFTRYFSLGDFNNSMITISNDSSIVLPANVKYSEANKKITYLDNVKLTKGANVIGNITYTYGDKTVGKTDILMTLNKDGVSASIVLPEDLKTTVTDDSSSESDDESFFDKIPIKKILIGLGIIIVVAIIIYIIFRNRGNRRRRRRRNTRHFSYDYKYLD